MSEGKQEGIEAEAKRFANNAARVPLMHTVMRGEVVDYLMEHYGGSIFCNGWLRNFKADPLGPNTFKVYTEAV